jgi:hypothetical protein
MDMTDDPNLEKQLADLGADHEPAEDWQVRVWKQIKARFPTGTQVRIIRGEYAGRSGTATDNVDKLQALDALIQRNTHLGAKIRKQHEIPIDKVCVILDVDRGHLGRRDDRVLIGVGDLRTQESCDGDALRITCVVIALAVAMGAVWATHWCHEHQHEARCSITDTCGGRP